ncbi:MAG: ribosomal RNA small subunit methyltransferase A, partial [Pseudonocardiaceae bacterium]
VLTADALRVRHPELVAAAGAPPTALVANLPYNVGVPVLLHLLAELPSLRGGLVMVQAEVADRLAAEPGTASYGGPSVKAAWFADVRRAGAVPRGVFWPVPNVDSGLVAFSCHPPPSTVPRTEVFTLVDAAFAQRRKTLRAALSSWAGSPATAEHLLRAAAIDPRARGEQLTVSDFARLASLRSGCRLQ